MFPLISSLEITIFLWNFYVYTHKEMQYECLLFCSWDLMKPWVKTSNLSWDCQTIRNRFTTWTTTSFSSASPSCYQGCPELPILLLLFLTNSCYNFSSFFFSVHNEMFQSRCLPQTELRPLGLAVLRKETETAEFTGAFLHFHWNSRNLRPGNRNFSLVFKEWLLCNMLTRRHIFHREFIQLSL